MGACLCVRAHSASGNVLILYTDGISDTQDQGQASFGEDGQVTSASQDPQLRSVHNLDIADVGVRVIPSVAVNQAELDGHGHFLDRGNGDLN
jgi:hypothetical protein